MAHRVQRYLITGILTVIPLLVTVFIFQFFLNLLSNVGKPAARVVARGVGEYSPVLERWLLEIPWLQSVVAVLVTVAALYLLGWAVSLIVGRRVLALLEYLVSRIPLVTQVYGATKQLVQAFQKQPEGRLRRVVLIEFPHKEMKAVGFVTETLVDEVSGAELAAVYVPTTPNPTSGYLEIVPAERLVSLDWTLDEAMSFIISGGTVSPGRIRFTNPPGTGSPPAPNPDSGPEGDRQGRS